MNQVMQKFLVGIASLVGAVGVAWPSYAEDAEWDYVLDTPALVPIREFKTPDGKPLPLVVNGEYSFALAWDVGCEKNCGDYRPTKASVTPAIAVLTEAFEHTFGRKPDVVDAKDAAALARYRHVIAVGPSPLTRRLGRNPSDEPDQGFSIFTSGSMLVLHGNDSSCILGYNTKPWEKRGSSLGTYYAALDFCERFLGARYFFPGEYGTLWRPRKNLTVRPVSYTDAPYFNDRNNLYHFNSAFRGEDVLAKWRDLMGEDAVTPNDGSYIYRWRIGWTNPPGGSHAPDPLRFGPRHSNDVEKIFYKNPYGHLSWYPKTHVPNLYDVTNLGLIDYFIDDIRAQLGGPQPKWDTLGWPTLNLQYVPFGQCDTYMQLQSVAFDKEVRELGLINPADLERARCPDGSLRNDAGCFANIWGRFMKAYADRVAKEFPGQKLYCLVYYNAKFPPNDPRYKVPENIEISFCDHRLPRRLYNRGDREDVIRIAKEWYEALGGRPVSRAWLYASSQSTFSRAVGAEFVGEVPKALGKYLGRGACFYDCNGAKDLWHFYYAFYAGLHSQWNPDFDVDAAIDEHWAPFYGAECGSWLKEFHALLKKSYIKYLCEPDGMTESEKYDVKLPAEVVDRLEACLKKAQEAVAKGSVFEKRLRLFSYPWPEAFRKRREEIAAGEPLTPEERKIWKTADMRIDSWDGVYAAYRLDVDPYKGNRANIKLEFANELTRYTFNILSSLPTAAKRAQQSFSIGQSDKKYGYTWADAVAVSVNGMSFHDLEILPTDVTFWSHGSARGYDVRLAFPNAPMTLKVSLKEESKNLRFELVPADGACVNSASVRITAVPSFFEVKNGRTRFEGYRREVKTATRLLRGEKGQVPQPLGADDRYIVFQDADYDGTTPEKGVGPCAVLPDFDAVDSACCHLSDRWNVIAEFKLKPDFERFRFALYEDRDRRVSNADFCLSK